MHKPSLIANMRSYVHVRLVGFLCVFLLLLFVFAFVAFLLLFCFCVVFVAVAVVADSVPEGIL